MHLCLATSTTFMVQWSLKIAICRPQLKPLQDHNISKKNEKDDKYIDVASAVRAEHKVKTEIDPIKTGVLDRVSKRLKTMLLVSQTSLLELKSPPLQALLEFC